MNINLPDLQENIPLKKYTTFKIGGPAKYFFTALTEQDLIAAVEEAHIVGIPYYILGSGANVLVSDKGFNGLVIYAKNDAIEINETVVRAEAGASIGKLVHTTVNAGLAGAECWAGIPGTVGGSIYGNMGLPSVEKGEVSDWVTSVDVFRNGNKETLSKEACNFAYRHSGFKETDTVILSATFKFVKASDIDALKAEMKTYQKKKLGEQPLELPSSGCIFKNPEGSKAGMLIDQVGLKGKKIGGAQISEKHANFINNIEDASAEDVVTLISIIKQKVRDEKRIQLVEEINYLGF